MRKLVFAFVITLFCCCTSTKGIRTTKPYSMPLEFIEINTEFELILTRFYKNSASCATEGIPYALLIGKTSNKNLPKIISVFSVCDNNDYEIGKKYIIKQGEDPTLKTASRPIYFVEDTLVNNEKRRKIVGAEYKAVWGIPKSNN